MAIREIGASVTLDASTFKKEMSAVNSNLSGLQSEMKAVTAEFADNADSVEALTAKQKILDQLEDQQKVKLDALTKAYDEQAAATGENSVEADRLRKQLNDARTALAKTRTQIKENTEAQKELNSATKSGSESQDELKGKTDASSGAIGTLTERLKDYSKRQEERRKNSLTNQLKELAAAAIEAAHNVPVLGTALKGLEKGFKVTQSALSATAKGVAALTSAAAIGATALGTLAAAGISTLSHYATDAAERTQKAMEQAEEYQKAAEEAAANGDLETAEKLRQQAAEASAQIDQRFSSLATNLLNLSSASQAAKDALGTLLLPALEALSGEGAALLQGFSKDLAACEGDTEKMAAVISKYIKKAAELLKKELPNLIRLGSDILKALVEGIGDALPELMDTAGEIMEMLIDGLVTHADEIGETAADIVTKLVTFLIDHAPDLLIAGVELLTSLVTGISEHIDEIVDAISGAVDAIIEWLSTDDNLLTLVEAAIHIVSALAKGLIENAGKLIEKLPDLVRSIIDWFKEPKNLESLKEGALALITSLADALIAAADALWDVGVAIVDAIWGGVESAWHEFATWFENAVSGLANFDPFGVLSSPEEIEGFFNKVRAEGQAKHAGGLNFVPYDNYPAILHRGERILTAAENAAQDSGAGGNTVNITINARELSRAQTNYFLRQADARLGAKA